MISGRVLTGFILIINTTGAYALEKSIDYSLSSQRIMPTNGLFFSGDRRYENRGAIDFAFEDSGLRLEFTATNGMLMENDEISDQVILKELFIDFSRFNLDFSVGKKRLDWGVGYAYRPLNFFATETINSTSIEINEGVWQFSIDKFTGFGSISGMAYSNEMQVDTDQESSSGAGVRVYGLIDDWEFQGMGFYDSLSRGIAGASASTVVGLSTAVHGSLLWQQRFRWVTHGSDAESFTQNTVRTREARNGVQLLVGGTYTFSNNISILSEYWFDGRSLSASGWSDLLDAANQQAQVPELAPLLSAGRQVFGSTNVLPHNLLLHARHEGVKLDSTLDIQWAPQDSGFIATATLTYEWSPGHTAKVGHRWFGGSADSVFSQLPDEEVLFIKFEGRY